MKENAVEVPAIKTIIEKMEEEMAGNGRILSAQVERSPSRVSWQKHQQQKKSTTM